MLKSLVSIFLLASFLIAINAECTINIGGDAPIFTKQFRRKTITLPRKTDSFALKDGEKISAHCSKGLVLQGSGYENIGVNDGVVSIEIECSSNNYITYKNLVPAQNSYLRNSQTSSLTVYCAHGTQAYESATGLTGCQNYTSIGIGNILQGNKQIVAAAVCFDFDSLTTKYVKYLAGRPKIEIFNEDLIPKRNMRKTAVMELGLPMENFETLFNDLNKISFESKFAAVQANNPFLSSQKFDYVNLIQDPQLYDDVKSFEYFTSTVWWQNLRLGNWKLFLRALEVRTEKVKYMIYSGTSGQLTMPSSTRCEEKEVFQINSSEGAFKVPEIIWAYVKPVVEDQRDEFVVFGYNTPFYSSQNETIRCKDMCSEIDWLQNHDFGKINLLPTFGVVHCCRAGEVASQLDTFPMELLSKKPATTTTERTVDEDF